MSRTLFGHKILVGGLLFISSHAFAALADGESPNLTLEFSTSEEAAVTVQVPELSSMTNLGNGDFNYVGDSGEDNWSLAWDMTVNPDPYIDTTLTLDNLTASTQTYNLLFTLPITPPFSPGFKSGELSLSFMDLNEDDFAAVSINNWEGLIDGSTALTLLATTIPCSGTGCTGTLFPVSTGPLLHPAGVSSDLGLLISFDLSAGDTVTIDTRFEVTPVPLPPALLFLSSALGLLAFSRKRRAS